MPDTGATIAFVQAATGRRPDIVVGKPNRLILEAASRKLGLPLDSMAMIGDRLYTDIALGASGEIVTVLVLSGETKRADIPASPFRPDCVFENLGQVAEWLERNS
jgi:NagD protein